MKKLIILITLLSSSALGGELITQYGPTELNHISYNSIGYKWLPKESLPWLRVETLLGVKNNNVLASSPIFIAEISPVLEVRPSFFYARFGNGIAIISGKDRYLNSYYQFATSAAIGIRWKGLSLGYLFKHYSNGSNSSGNRGWNFKGIEITYNMEGNK